MCIARAWEARPIRSEIMSMENNRPSCRNSSGLPTAIDMLNHRREIGPNACEKLGDLTQAPLNCVEARRRRLAASVAWLTWRGQFAAPEHRIKVLRFPAERYRQRFQSSRATAALNSLTLNFPHDRGRHTRAFRKLALTPSKLSHPFIHGLSDGCPILRHPIPPRSALGAEVSRSARFCGTPQGLDWSDRAQGGVCIAEIIDESLKSAQLLMSARVSLGRGRNDS